MSDEMNAIPTVDADGKTTETVKDTAPEKPMVDKAALADAPAEVGGRDEAEAPVLERTKAANDASFNKADVADIDTPYMNKQQSQETTALTTSFSGQEIDLPEQDMDGITLQEEKEGTELAELDSNEHALAEMEADEHALAELGEEGELAALDEQNSLALAEEPNGELAEMEASESLPAEAAEQSAELVTPEMASAELEAQSAGAEVSAAAAKAVKAQEAAQSAVKAGVADTKKVHEERKVEVNDTRVNFGDAGDVAEYVAPKGSEMRNEGIVSNTVADAQKSGLDQKDAERAAMSQVAQGNIGSLEGTGNDRMNETQDRSRVKAVARAGAASGVQAAQTKANEFATVEIKEQTERSEDIKVGEKAASSMEAGSQNMADVANNMDSPNQNIEDMDVGEMAAVAGDLNANAALPEMDQMESLEGAEHENMDASLLIAAEAAQAEMIEAVDKNIIAIEAAQAVEKPLELEVAPNQEQTVDFASLEAANDSIDNSLEQSDPQLAIESGGRSR